MGSTLAESKKARRTGVDLQIFCFRGRGVGRSIEGLSVDEVKKAAVKPALKTVLLKAVSKSAFFKKAKKGLSKCLKPATAKEPEAKAEVEELTKAVEVEALGEATVLPFEAEAAEGAPESKLAPFEVGTEEGHLRGMHLRRGHPRASWYPDRR